MTDRPPPTDSPQVAALSPLGRSVLRWGLRLGLVLLFVLLAGALALRALVLPHVDEYRDQIVDLIESRTGLSVQIGRLEADWRGLHLRLRAHEVEVGAESAGEGLHLERVEALTGWSALLLGQPVFRQLVLVGPELAVVRESDGRIRLAGIEISDEPRDGPGLADWMLQQHEIAIVGAAIAWEDRRRGAPVLQLEDFDLRVERVAGRYRFGLQGQPGETLADRLDVRGDLVSDRPVDPARWSGQVFLQLSNAQLQGLAPWVDYPMSVSGQGSVEAWVEVETGRPQSATVDFSLAHFEAQLEESAEPFSAPYSRGRLQVVWRDDEHRVKLSDFELMSAEGEELPPVEIELRLSGQERLRGAGELSASRLDLAGLARLGAALPLPDEVHEALEKYRPEGRLQDLRIGWHSPQGQTRLSAFEAGFKGVSFAAVDGLPGLENVSGEIRGNDQQGHFLFSGQDVVADLPAIFPESTVSFARFDAKGDWIRAEKGLEVRLERAQFENPDAAGEASGVLRPEVGRRGEIELTARLTRAEGDAVWRYLPHVVNEYTRNWLRSAIAAGKVHDARLSLQGELDKFPFEQDEGRFQVQVELTDGRLEYAPDWPAIEAVAASLRFEGPGLFIEAAQGRIFGVELSEVEAAIPDLDADGGAVLSLTGKARGASADFLRFVSESPVRERVDGFTDGMSASGTGVLDLKLEMPLENVNSARVEGSFRFAGNRIGVLEWLPPLEGAKGVLRFSEKSFAIEGAEARLFGEPLKLTARTLRPGEIRFDVAGGASVRAARQFHDWPFLEHLSGAAKWQAVIDVAGGGARVDLRSTLAGLSSSLPQPLNKRMDSAWPLQLEVGFRGDERSVRGQLAEWLELELHGRALPGRFDIRRGGVALNTPLSVPAQGVDARLRLDELDVDAWRAVFEGGAQGANSANSGALTALDVKLGRLRAFGYDFSPFELQAEATASGWNGQLESEQVAGGFAWNGEDDGQVALRLERLRLGERKTSDAQLARLLETDEHFALPGMDIVASGFELYGRRLGRLSLQARNEGGLWWLDSLSIANSDARLTGSGRWQPGRAPQTQLSLNFDIRDIGAFLARIGYPEVVRDGTARLSGDLRWRGIPTRIDQATLDGLFRLEAENGRFAKLEPGVGRLLGVLSLQSLPRRLKLDFSDVFSDGFAFDRIAGDGRMQAGVLASDNLEIHGPAARIWLAGTASLVEETQDLKVVVQPTLSESVAVGAAAGLINPVAGVVAYLAQKVLSDPIERMFAYGYAITGSWSDPQVEKLPVGLGSSDSGASVP